MQGCTVTHTRLATMKVRPGQPTTYAAGPHSLSRQHARLLAPPNHPNTPLPQKLALTCHHRGHAQQPNQPRMFGSPHCWTGNNKIRHGHQTTCAHNAHPSQQRPDCHNSSVLVGCSPYVDQPSIMLAGMMLAEVRCHTFCLDNSPAHDEATPLLSVLPTSVLIRTHARVVYMRNKECKTLVCIIAVVYCSQGPLLTHPLYSSSLLL